MKEGLLLNDQANTINFEDAHRPRRQAAQKGKTGYPRKTFGTAHDHYGLGFGELM